MKLAQSISQIVLACMLCNSNGPEYCGLLCHSTLFLVKLESALPLQQQGALVQLQAFCLGIQGRLCANKQASKWFAYSVNKSGCLTTATAAGGKLGRLLLALHEVESQCRGRLLDGAQEAETGTGNFKIDMSRLELSWTVQRCMRPSVKRSKVMTKRELTRQLTVCNARRNSSLDLHSPSCRVGWKAWVFQQQRYARCLARIVLCCLDCRACELHCETAQERAPALRCCHVAI